VIWIVSDYRAWKSLGKGGVPYNFRGWLMVTRFRPAKRDPFGTDIYNDRIGSPEDTLQLDNLPTRQGPRFSRCGLIETIALSTGLPAGTIIRIIWGLSNAATRP
jgi:hypothetical protein